MLSNIKKILLFINLLNNREYVTKKEVLDFCGMGTRSFYRYINLLSEINVPVYFDKSVKAYRLSAQISKQQKLETINEIIIQLISLIKYSKTIQGHFKKEIDYLIKKIISISKFNLDEIINAYIDQIKPNNSEADEEIIIKSILIDVAIANSLDILATYRANNSHKENIIRIESPRLEYKNDWLLIDRVHSIIIPLDSIAHIKLL